MHVVMAHLRLREKRRTVRCWIREHLSECCTSKRNYKSPPLSEGRRSLIVDTTPTMYQTVVAMSNRFKIPCQFLANVDYQSEFKTGSCGSIL